MLKLSKKIISFFLVCIFFFLLNCSGNPNKIKKLEKVLPLNILYKEAFKSFKENDWDKSIEMFKTVERNYSYSEWAPRAMMMIMYIYYESNQSYKALEYVRKFKKLHPRDKNIVYVNFIKALIFYEQINVVSKDQTYTEAALNEFLSIIKKYPDTIYANESKLKIDLINEQLAGKQMYIARYYIKKSKWIPAIKRLKIVIENYNTTIYTKEALHRLVEIYYNLGNIKEAKKYAAILGYNFNDSNWYKKSYKIVGNKDYNLEDKKISRKLKDRIISLFKFSK